MMQRTRPSGARSTGYGAGEHTIDLPEGAFADADELKLKLLAIFRAPNYKPPVLPRVALDLMEISRDPNVSYGEVLRVLERDPLIVADVLRIAQSPLYSPRAGVQSLNDVLNRLGMSTLLNVVWQTVANVRLFRVKGYADVMQRLQAHCLFTAHVARIIAGHAGIAPDSAFLCGLLHDVGISGTVIAIAESSGRQVPPPIDLLWAALDQMHVAASDRLARMWGLSPELCEVIGGHHQRGDRSHFANPLIATICLAEAIAEEFGFGVMPADPSQPPGRGIDQNPPAQVEQAAIRLNVQTRLAGIRYQAQRVAELLSAPTI